MPPGEKAPEVEDDPSLLTGERIRSGEQPQGEKSIFKDEHWELIVNRTFVSLARKRPGAADEHTGRRLTRSESCPGDLEGCLPSYASSEPCDQGLFGCLATVGRLLDPPEEPLLPDPAVGSKVAKSKNKPASSASKGSKTRPTARTKTSTRELPAHGSENEPAAAAAAAAPEMDDGIAGPEVDSRSDATASSSAASTTTKALTESSTSSNSSGSGAGRKQHRGGKEAFPAAAMAPSVVSASKSRRIPEAVAIWKLWPPGASPPKLRDGIAGILDALPRSAACAPRAMS
mmetsp:Transcript_62810/g.149840  ORF Transcript_62810/g.149840 Transcript_62810/m.149840 type:complete len:288 (-) Transcript_62810:38-901(-)